MPAHTPPLRIRAVRVVLIAVVLQTLFVFFFVVPGHDPEPNGFPVVAAGPPAAVEAFGAQLERRGDFAFERVASAAEGRRRVEDREAYGAFVLGPRGVERTITASAASLPASQLVTGIGAAAGARQVENVRPLVAEDPRGVTLNLLVLPITLTAILAALVAANLVADVNLRGRVGLTALAGILGGLVVIGLVNGWLGALPGPWLAEAGVLALAVLAIGLPSAGVLRLVGPAGTAIPFLFFLMLGNPASGAASAPELLPTPWHPLGALLPPGALGDALRGTAYFDGASVTGGIVVLIAWALIGVGLLALGERRATGPRPDPA